MSTNTSEYMLKYQKERLRRVSIDFRKDDYPPIKEAADASGMSVSGYIKDALRERMERDKAKE